jgi:hypothetical protein
MGQSSMAFGLFGRKHSEREESGNLKMRKGICKQSRIEAWDYFNKTGISKQSE